MSTISMLLSLRLQAVRGSGLLSIKNNSSDLPLDIVPSNPVSVPCPARLAATFLQRDMNSELDIEELTAY